MKTLYELWKDEQSQPYFNSSQYAQETALSEAIQKYIDQKLKAYEKVDKGDS